MKATLLVLAIFGLAAMAGGQSSVPTQTVQIAAASATRTGDLVQYRGNVRLSLGAMTVIADEVDLPTGRHNPDGSPSTMQVRGNVRVSIDSDVPIVMQRQP
jgi:lipopolysaccharide export system protein LptA